MVLFKAKNYIDELDLIIKNKFEKLETDKKLSILTIGSTPSIDKFVEIKKNIASYYGIEVEVFTFKNSAKKSEVFDKLTELNNDENCGGIIIQYPFPEKFEYSELASKISPKKDVDFFTPENFGKFALNFDTDFAPPTVKALDFIINTFKLDLNGKNYVVLGQGVLVGRPISLYLLNKGATVVSLNEYTEEREKILQYADCVICGANSPKILKGTDLKRGASVIDFSGSLVKDKITGDFDLDTQINHLNIVSGVPGGVGPLTVRFLFLNFLDFVENSIY